MTEEVQLVNEDGVLVGRDPETGEKVPVEIDEAVVNTLESESHGTDKLSNTIVLKEGDDAHALLDNASVGTTVFIADDATYELRNPTLAADITFIGTGTFQKGADGPLLTYDDRFSTYGGRVTFDGNKTNHTGKGLVPNTTEHRQINVNNAEFYNFAGYAVEMDMPRVWRFSNCEWSDNDDFCVRLTSTHTNPADVPHYGEFRNSSMALSGGGFLIDNGIRHCQFDVRIRDMSGPGYEFRGDGGATEVDPNVNNIRIDNLISQCDGPALLFDGHRRLEMQLSCFIKQNVASPDAGLTSPVGQIHFENYDTSWWQYLAISSGEYGASQDASDVTVVDHSGNNQVHVQVAGGRGDQGSLENVWGNVLNAHAWRNTDFSSAYEMTGLYSRTSGSDNPYIVDLVNDARFYFTPTNNVQSSGSGGSLYFDDGTNTGSGNPAWRFDSDGDGTYESETN